MKKTNLKIRRLLQEIKLPEDCHTEKDCDLEIKKCIDITKIYKALKKEVPTSLLNRLLKLSSKLELIYINNQSKTSKNARI